MQYLLLGLAALLTFLVLARLYTMANPQLLIRQLRLGSGLVALGAAFLFVLRGGMAYAIASAALGPWLLLGGGSRLSRPVPGDGAAASPGRTSRINTEYLEVELDHDTGQIRGRVLKGAFVGCSLENLAPVEVARLWQECLLADPQSAQTLEAHLDRAHPTWREDMAHAGGGTASPDGKMSRAPALDILGLKEGASEHDIRRAHRELMLKIHPDRGGSTYLAAKINEAKEVLLGM